MLRVLGRSLPNLKLETATDKTLYIDIDHQPLEPVLELAPTNTYIISNRPLADLEKLIAAGYFNIACVTQASQITTRFIANFINTDYYDNNLQLLSKRLLETYAPNEALINQLYEALVALRDDNAEKFSQIMSFNLISFIESIDDINSMISYCKSMGQASEQYSQAIAKIAQLDSIAKEAEYYRGLYEDLRAAKTLADEDKKDLEQRLAELQAQISSVTVTEADVHSHVDFKTLQTRLEAISAERDIIKREFDEYKRDAEEQATLVGGGAKDNIIKQLRDEIKKLKEFPFDQTINSCMPVFQEATTLEAEHLLYFKEVRPTVYINGAIYWLSSFLNIRYRNMQRKEFLILVFDPLIDQYTKDKYVKHGWSVNQAPSASNHVLVTNCFDYSKLKSQYHIEAYNCIICIDRTHVKTDAISIKRCKKFYFINTTNDITDFNLEPVSCIGFFESVPSGALAVPKYRIKPWDKSLTSYTDITRSGKFTEDKIFSTILEECGVITRV